jgi:hypothetical protein
MLFMDLLKQQQVVSRLTYRWNLTSQCVLVVAVPTLDVPWFWLLSGLLRGEFVAEDFSVVSPCNNESGVENFRLLG